MSLADIFLLLFSCAGLSFILVHSEIMDIIGLRPLWEKSEFLKKLFHCSFCTGNWIGVFYASSLILIKLFISDVLFYICAIPFASAAFCFLWDRIVIFIDNKIIEQEKK